jgi:hypothetical protein
MEHFSEDNLAKHAKRAVDLLGTILGDRELPAELRVVYLGLLSELIGITPLIMNPAPTSSINVRLASGLTTMFSVQLVKFALLLTNGNEQQAQMCMDQILESINKRSAKLIASEKETFDSIKEEMGESEKKTDFSEEVEELLKTIQKRRGLSDEKK